MSRQLHPPVSVIKTEPLTIIKNEPPESEIMEIGMVDVVDSSDKDIVSDIKDIDIKTHVLYEDSIKSESVFEGVHSESAETQILVKTENTSFVKIENKNESENIIKTENTSDVNSLEMVEVQGSNEHFNILNNLETDKQLDFFKDLNDIGTRDIKVKQPEMADFVECYKTVESTSWEKDKGKIKVIKAPVIPLRFCCEKCGFLCRRYSDFKIHKLSHKTKAQMDDWDLKYRCDKCDFKTYKFGNLKMHEITHLKPEEIQYFYCCHCSYKCPRKNQLKRHISQHHKEIKTHSKCSETKHIYQLKNHTKKQEIRYCNKCDYISYSSSHLKEHKLIHLKPEEIQYFYCHHCPQKSKRKFDLKTHISRHFANGEIKFDCYICNFMTLKRESIIEHMKEHSKVQIKSEINEGS